MSPRLRFLLYILSKEIEYYNILNIKAKCNILSIEIAKNLSYIIYSVNIFTIFTIIRD